MNRDYTLKYFEQIEIGLKQTQYKTSRGLIEKQTFFDELVELSKKIQEKKGRIFFIGNGASAAFSNHMALDWSKNGGILATSLSDSALLTALSNDYSYESAFVEFLKINDVDTNDLVVTISSSGNSGNIVAVLDYCNQYHIPSLGLSGLKQENSSVKKAQYSIYVPMKTYGLVECIHQIFLHLWLDMFMGIEEWNRSSFQNMDSSNFNL